MRLVRHVGSCLVRYHANASAYCHVNTLQLPPRRMAVLRPSMNASFPRRNLSLSPSDPITISEDRQTITFRLDNGETITQKISATPKANRDKLANALASLLSTPETPNLSLKHSSSLSFGTTQWQLDALGDAIHRHTAHSSASECEEVEKLIMVEAEKMNHHHTLPVGNLAEKKTDT
ncbi:hypothetical protein CLAIMM_09017 [Cladophialophora immunda]|nr:hypothetical protein CLAIMM_09017 [Cladophialophora immunda]